MAREGGRRYGGVAQAQREQARRAALIDAATEVFGTHGFRRATVRSVCGLAKLNDRYFYAAFDNMEHLLRATYAHHAQTLLERLQAAIADSAPTLDARLDAGLNAFFTFLRQPHAARVLLLEVMGVSPETDLTYQRYIFEFAKLILAMANSMDEPPPTGDDAQAQARIVGLALVGAMTNAGTAWVLMGYQDTQACMVASCRRVLRGALI
ncbi:TetR family transcriptional regulator [Pandoraea aquatica]|uniref:TetR family transcriptional regulator n=2 Tax=Pandoraea aquatica TaxID=2508290 RepID=A0A5E4WQN9_9BURK|nr:TetR family transcriptional regulator [Pandoraea aquatica]